MVGSVRGSQDRVSERLGERLEGNISQEHVDAAGRRLRNLLFRKSLIRRAGETTLKGVLFVPMTVLKTPITIINMCMSIVRFGQSMSLAEAACLIKDAAFGCGVNLDGHEVSEGEGAMSDSASKASGFKGMIVGALKRTGGTIKAIFMFVSLILAKLSSLVGLLVTLPVFFIVGLILLCTFTVLVIMRALLGKGPRKADLEMKVVVPRNMFKLFKSRIGSDMNMSLKYMKAMFNKNIEEIFKDCKVTCTESGTIYLRADANSAAVMHRAALSVFGGSAPKLK